jgi:hypothetical protein
VAINVPPTTADPQAWRDAYDALPEHVKQAIFDHALTACPHCGTRGVPVSWAVVAVEALRESD